MTNATTVTKITTIGQAADYTTRTRSTWRSGPGSRTAAINTGHVIEHLGRSFPVARINQACVSQLTIDLEERGMSSSTINRVISALSTILNHCHFDGLIAQPCKFRRLKEGEHRLTWYTKEEVEQMACAAVDPFDRLDLSHIIPVAGYTGMRMSELLSLRVLDVDLGANHIHVGGRPGFQTKARNYRCIPIHDRIKDIFSSRMSNVGPNVKVFGDEWNDKDQLLRAFKKVRDYVGKDESYVFHSLRHSFCTWLAEGGVPIRTIMDLAGHKQITTTLRYAKTTDRARVDAMGAI